MRFNKLELIAAHGFECYSTFDRNSPDDTFDSLRYDTIRKTIEDNLVIEVTEEYERSDIQEPWQYVFSYAELIIGSEYHRLALADTGSLAQLISILQGSVHTTQSGRERN